MHSNDSLSLCQVLTIERMVFDVLGQMWGALMINGMTALCTLVGMAAITIMEKAAIAVVSGPLIDSMDIICSVLHALQKWA